LIAEKKNKTDRETIGIILLNLGGPDSLQAVRPFLFNLFSDRYIIQLGPPFLQKPIAWLIAKGWSKKTEKTYSLIGGKSPILDITRAQADALERALNLSNNSLSSSFSFKVYIGMRYWRPFIDEVIPVIYEDGIQKLIALSLYPHYSVATSGSSIAKFNEVVAGYPIDTHCISSWFNHPLYINALVDVIKRGMESFQLQDIHILFSAHSLPQKIIEEGDPYVDHVMGTIQEITRQIPVPWHLSYQSKSGPVKWLEPSTEDTLRRFAREGVKNVLVVPISFVSDHIETLYEIDMLYKNFAENLGIRLSRVDSLNTHRYFVDALKDMVGAGIREKGWISG
jgi:ferrochelatase